jgi:hypothetical protein
VVILLATSAAFAAACCGTTSDTPAVLARCDEVGVAFTMGGSQHLARWDDAGTVQATSDSQLQLTGTLAGAARFAPWLQASVAVPFVGTFRSAGELETSAAGLGDIRVGARLKLPEALPHMLDPYLDVGVTTPSGTGPDQSVDPLAADITGMGELLGSATLGLQRSPGLWPWHVEARFLGAPSATNTRVEAGAGVARRLTEHWMLAANGSYALGLVEPTRRSTLGLSTVVDGGPRFRTWAGASLDLPVSQLGRALPIEGGVSAGLMFVR